jgi:hypothetical protein
MTRLALTVPVRLRNSTVGKKYIGLGAVVVGFASLLFVFLRSERVALELPSLSKRSPPTGQVATNDAPGHGLTASPFGVGLAPAASHPANKRLTVWQDLTEVEGMRAWLRAVAQSEDAQARRAAEQMLFKCASLGASDSELGGAKFVDAMRAVNGGRVVGSLAEAEFASSRSKYREMCREFVGDLAGFRSYDESTIGRKLEKARRNPTVGEGVEVLVKKLLDNPSAEPMTFDAWLANDMWKGFGAELQSTHFERAYVEDFVYSRFITRTDGGWRDVQRCAVLLKCNPTSVVPASRRAELEAFGLKVEQAIRAKNWDVLLRAR